MSEGLTLDIGFGWWFLIVSKGENFAAKINMVLRSLKLRSKKLVTYLFNFYD